MRRLIFVVTVLALLVSSFTVEAADPRWAGPLTKPPMPPYSKHARGEANARSGDGLEYSANGAGHRFDAPMPASQFDANGFEASPFKESAHGSMRKIIDVGVGKHLRLVPGRTTFKVFPDHG